MDLTYAEIDVEIDDIYTKIKATYGVDSRTAEACRKLYDVACAEAKLLEAEEGQPTNQE